MSFAFGMFVDENNQPDQLWELALAIFHYFEKMRHKTLLSFICQKLIKKGLINPKVIDR